MNIKTILDYQKEDAKIIKLEKQLEGDASKKQLAEMIAIVKQLQGKSVELENEANSIRETYEKLKKNYEDNIKSSGMILNKNVETTTEDEMESIIGASNTIKNNLNIIEKKMINIAERSNAVLSEFETIRKKHDAAKKKYAEIKKVYEEKSLKINPEIEKIKNNLKTMEKDIDSELLSVYKQKRLDRIYPVFVPMIDKTCGGCRMELSTTSIENLKSKKIMPCEHCRRVMYSD